jgi:RNA polymerase sigma factor (sigma-70 family)
VSTDKEIISRSRNGPAAFGELYDRHAGVVFRYASRRAGDTAAEDVMAETFLVAFENRHSFNDSTDSALPWLLGIATNLLKHHHRSEARALRAYVKSANRQPEPWSDAVDHQIDVGVATGLVAAELAAMAAIDRDTILLYTWGGLSYTEISAAMDVPVGTVRSRLNRARKTLRAALGFSPLTEKDTDHGRSAAAAQNA